MSLGAYTPNSYTGDDTSTVFPYTFKIFSETDLEVIKREIATGAETTLTYTTHYSVSGVVSGEGSPDTGGNCTLTSPLLDEYQLILRRKVPYTQGLDLTPGDNFPADSVETAIDKAVAMSQQNNETIGRAIVRGANETSQLIFPALVALGYLRVNSAGTGLELSDEVETTVGTYPGTIGTGADASKAASPGAGDIYVATDTEKIYACYTAGSWTHILPTASATVAGMAELATIAETSAGTDTGRVITPAGLAGSVVGQKTLIVSVFAAGDTVSTGDGKYSFSIPATINGMRLKDIASHVYTVSTSGLPTVQIRKKKISDDSEVDVLTTKVSIDENERDSSTATTAAVIDTTKDDVATGDEYYVDVDIAGTGTKGLDLRLTFGI